MDSILNITPEGSLSDLAAATGGDADLRKEQQAPEAPEIEIRGTQPSTTMLDQTEETPYTSVQVVPGRISAGQRAGQVDIPRRVLRMREASQGDALESARHFFASENGQNQAVTLGLPEEIPVATVAGTTLETSTPAITTTVPTTSTATTTTGAETGSPRSFLPNGSTSILGPPQQLLVGHKHGYREFQKVGQMFLPWMVLTQERVVYLNLRY